MARNAPFGGRMFFGIWPFGICGRADSAFSRLSSALTSLPLIVRGSFISVVTIGINKNGVRSRGAALSTIGVMNPARKPGMTSSGPKIRLAIVNNVP